jgi:DNA-binding beta-propeller fold protein YncE
LLGNGEEEDAFDVPLGVALDESGNLYVLDSGNNRVVKFDPDGTAADEWAATGFGVEVDGDAVVFVPSGAFTVARFETDGDALAAFQGGGLSGATDVAVDADRNVFVIDSTNHFFVKFNQAGSTVGNPIGGFGRCGSHLQPPVPCANASFNAKFNFPNGIAIDPGPEIIYVADTFNHRIQRLDGAGSFDDQWGEFGTCGGEDQSPCSDPEFNHKFNSPSGIAVDFLNNVFVADFGNDRIMIYRSDGELLGRIGSSGSESGQLDGPADVAVDEDGNVFVADTFNNRVVKFAPIGVARRRGGVRPELPNHLKAESRRLDTKGHGRRRQRRRNRNRKGDRPNR